MRAVATAFPDFERVLAAPSWQAPIAQQCGVSWITHTDRLTPLDTQLSGADVAIDLHGCGPESIRLLDDLFPRCLVAFRHDSVPSSHRGPEWDSADHEIDRWCRLLNHYGITTDRHDLGLRYSSDRQPAGTGDHIVVHPGAAAAGRRWPAPRFASVIAHLLDAGHRVVLTGSAGERALCRQVYEMVTASVPAGQERLVDLAGDTDLEQLCAVIGSGRAVLSNDTGVAHLAVAFDVASVTLFGPTSPALWGPPHDPKHRPIWKGRTGDPHASTRDPGLDAITVPEVIEQLEQVLALRGCETTHSGT